MSDVELQVGRLVGLARRGRRLVLGVPQVEGALRSGQAHLVFLATDGSYGQKKGVFGLSRKDRVPVHELYPSATLASWIGVKRVTAIAITDSNLARGLAALLGPPKAEAARADIPEASSPEAPDETEASRTESPRTEDGATDQDAR